LAKDVDDRYQHCSEFGEALLAFMYSTGNSYSRKDLAAFMKATFAEDYEKEKTRLSEYSEVKAPEGMLAAIDMGFGVGAVPAVAAAAQSPSAVTAVPTMMPISQSPNTQTAGTSPGLPPIVRPMPPTLAPVSAPPGNRPPSLTSMPRLTAVAPMLTSGKEEHESTVLADASGNNPFDEPATNPGNARQDPTRAFNIRNGAGAGEIATDPGRPAMTRPAPPVMAPPEPRKITRGLPAVPPPPPTTSDTSPTLSAVNYQTANTLMPVTNPEHYAQPAPPASNTRLIIALAAIVALLIVGVVGVVLLKPPASGLVMINVPDAVATSATVSINGKALTEKEWPQIISVPVGKVTVMVKAPGYEALVETLEVREGNEPAQLKQELKKKP
jgi:hypothetical protein